MSAARLGYLLYYFQYISTYYIKKFLVDKMEFVILLNILHRFFYRFQIFAGPNLVHDLV